MATDTRNGSPASIWLDVPDVDALLLALLIKRQQLVAARAEDAAEEWAWQG
jgi:hypothetical protein